MRRWRRWLVVPPALLLIAFAAFVLVKANPQDTPFAPLDLAETPGAFTGRKLAALGSDFPRCRRLLDRAGLHYTLLPEVKAGACGYSDGVRFAEGGSLNIPMQPGVGTSCSVAAGLAMWEWNVVQPAAIRYFGQAVTAIEHLGSYACRRMVGKYSAHMSEHATADAIDISGFRLADGTRVTVKGDWRGGGAKAAFLHDVRDGACKLFTMTLSPDYNAAHADHLHLDEGANGAMGWRGCH